MAPSSRNAAVASGEVSLATPRSERRGEEAAITSLVLDELGRITDASPEARSILGARIADLQGRPIGDLVTPEDQLRLARWLTEHRASALAGVGEVQPVAFRVARRHGRQASAQARVLPLSDSPGSVRVLVELSGADEDACEDQLAQLGDRIDQLARSNRGLEAMAGTAAHDLQAPLASLAATTEMLIRHAGPQLDETAQELVASLMRGVGHMSGLVDSLLRCSTAGVGLEIELGDGDELVTQALAAVQADLDEAGAVVAVAPIGPLVADLRQVQGVFCNLLSNAARHRSPERALRVQIEVTDGPVSRTFSVIDNGRGVIPEDRERVFGLFDRLDRRVPGSGIGLATCRRVIEGHGGEIWLDDGCDGGTAARFTLPGQPVLRS